MPLPTLLTRRRAAAVGVVALLFLVVSCSKDERLMTAVSGTVTVNGVPLETGQILIRHTSGEQRGYGVTIAAGKYELRCEPGEVRVEITAYRDVPGKFHFENGKKESVREQYIPVEYNRESTLVRELATNRNDDVSFELKTK